MPQTSLHFLSSPLVEGAPQDQALRTLLGVEDLRVGRIYAIETEGPAPTEALNAVARHLVCDLHEPYEVDAPFPHSAVGLAYKLGVVDNEAPTIIRFCAAHGLHATAAKVIDVYASASLGREQLAEVLRARVFNTSAQQMLLGQPEWEHLRPEGHAEPTQRFDLTALSDAELAELGTAGGRGLDLRQMQAIRAIQQETGAATTSDVLLEALDARWSDHCAHTTWKQHGNLLKRLKTASADTGNPNIISMFDDNAGVWEFYGGQSLTIKAETHNGPTAIAAYFGQLTKLGGVLRDILGTGLGSDPIGSFEYTATGVPGTPAPIADRPSPSHIALDTVRAIKEYGNTFGVPMMTSRMAFHPAYRAKPFALGGAIGIIPTAQAGRQHAQPGDLVVLVGGPTGGEGLHGASASSAGAEMVESAVQIGSPLEEIKFRSAILDWRDDHCLSAVTDLGAAGINSAAGEMGEACGVWVNTALVPLKTSALPVWKILLSESQERMLLAVKPEKLEDARRIAQRHDVPFAVIGRFVDSQRYTVIHDEAITEAALLADPALSPTAQPEAVAFDVPYSLIDPPVEQISVGEPPAATGSPAWPAQLPVLQDLFLRVMAHGDVQSQAWADTQYDSSVRGITVHGPQYGTATRVNTYYWAGQPVDGHPGVAIFTTDFSPALYEIDPVAALRQSVIRSLTMQVLAGSALQDVCLTDNFYTPHLTEHYAEWLVAMVDELAGLVRHFGTPVISGKDSSAGSVKTPEGLIHVPSAVYISALGKAPSSEQLLPEAWSTPGNALVRVGLPTPSFAGTVAAQLVQAEGGALDAVSAEGASAALSALAEVRGSFVSATMLGAGGFASSLARASLASGLGVTVDDTAAAPEELLAEHRACALVEVPADAVSAIPAALNPQLVGHVVAEPGVHVGGANLLTEPALTAWHTTFERSISGK